jgi:XTP/dITP diphosphohydrolase
MRELLLATKNSGKFEEIKEALKWLPFKFVFLRDLVSSNVSACGGVLDDSDFVEDGHTFFENAEKKARYYGEKTGLVTLGEDSGILVDALAGELGVQTRRWGAGEKASDKKWVEYFLEKMKDVPASKRGAKFLCCACVFVRGKVHLFMGETCGRITEKLMAPIKEGVPLSSCFIPDGLTKVYSALGPEEKNRVSHRGKAMAKVREMLEQVL